ncbi:MAG: hypothetical protein Q9157_008024 [Trypethelium eluteriae]
MDMETYHGIVRTPGDAIILFEACRQGLLPRVQRRLSEKERQSIRSGSVFVWDEREAGMRRWTDGKSWSASRVSGSFLTYREMEGKRGGGFPSQKRGNSKDGNKDAGSDADMADDGPDGYRYKPDGLMKQSFSITTQSGQHLHLISYFARTHPEAQELKQPSQDPHLNKIRPPKGMYPESTVIEQNIPPVTRAPMTSSPYTPSPQQMPTTSSPYNRANGVPHNHSLPHAYGPPPGYTWPPPTPMSTPPQSQHYSPYQQQGTPPIYMHPSPGHPSPLQYGYPAYSGATSHAGPGPTAFDRPPPPLAHTGLPPPPPHAQNGVVSHGLPPAGPQYVPHQSPRVPQAAEIVQQQLQPSQIQDLARPESAHVPVTSQPAVQPMANVQSQPPLSSHLENGEDRSVPHHSSSPRGDRRDSNPSGTTQSGSEAEAGTSTSSKIPSIHSLINGTNPEPSDVKSEGSASRAGSRSPGSQRNAQGPSEKIGFGEDKRALRVLDRAMMRS